MQVSPGKMPTVRQSQGVHEFRPAHLPLQCRDEPSHMRGHMGGYMGGHMGGYGLHRTGKRHRHPVGGHLDGRFRDAMLQAGVVNPPDAAANLPIWPHAMLYLRPQKGNPRALGSLQLASIGPELDVLAPAHKFLECLLIVEKHTVIHHSPVVVGQGLEERTPWHKLQIAGDRSLVVNPTPCASFSRKNIVLCRATDSARFRSSSDLSARPASSRRARSCQCRESRSPRLRCWRQNTCTAVAFSQKVRSANMTEGVGCGESNLRQIGCCVALDGACFTWLPGRACPELHRHLRPHEIVVRE